MVHIDMTHLINPIKPWFYEIRFIPFVSWQSPAVITGCERFCHMTTLKAFTSVFLLQTEKCWIGVILHFCCFWKPNNNNNYQWSFFSLENSGIKTTSFSLIETSFLHLLCAQIPDLAVPLPSTAPYYYSLLNIQNQIST